MSEVVNQPLILKKKSRSSRFSSWTGEANSFRDKFFRVIYVFLLFTLDLVMFIYSINGRLMEGNEINKAFLVILGGIFAVSAVAILCLAFSKRLQNLFCALVTMVVTVMFFYQFGLGDVDNFLEVWFDKHLSWLSFICFVPSPWLVGFILGVIIFFLFYFSDAILFVSMVLLFSGVIGIQKNEFLIPSKAEYEEVKRLPSGVGAERKSHIVYLMVPKFPSYQFLNTINDTGFKELRNLLIGFYAANDFEIYPNAFIKQNDTILNMIDVLNQVDYTSVTSANRGFAEFVNDWDFIHGGLNIIGLEDSRLYEYLKNSGFGVSMYAMPGFNFCLKGGNFATGRCVVKGYKVVPLYDKKATLEQNVYALLGEWLLSTKSMDLLSLSKTVIGMSSLKNMKILSENRRVSIEGSTHLFNKLAEDYKNDRGGQVYLAYVDLPSDVYIYDEYCNLKPRKDWVALRDNILYAGGIDDKRKGYTDQAKCLVAKLQEYMDDIAKTDKLNNTDIFIQGVSPIRELAGVVGDSYNRYVTDNLVNLAMRKGRNPKFLINANICLASDFTKTLIRYQDYCYSLEDEMKSKSKDEVYSLRRNLIDNAVIRGEKISNIVANYRDWYELYKMNNQEYQKRLQKEREERELQKKRQEEKAIDEDVMPIRETELMSGGRRPKAEENIFVPGDNVGVGNGADNKNNSNASKALEKETVVIPEVAPVVEEKAVKPQEKTENALEDSVNIVEDKPNEAEENPVAAQEEKTVVAEEPVTQEEKPIVSDENKKEAAVPAEEKKQDEAEIDLFGE